MKKTLMTLLALSGAAMADGELLWTLDFGTSADATRGYKVTAAQGHTYNPTVNLGSSAINENDVTTNTNTSVQIDGATGVKLADEFSCVVQLTLPDVTIAGNFQSNWPIIFSLGESNGECAKVTIYRGLSNHLKVDRDGYTFSNETESQTSATEGTHTLILTMTGESGQVGTMRMYWDGVLAEQLTVDAAHRDASSVIDDLSLGGRLNGTQHRMAASFDSIQMYSGVLSSGQIESLSLIPEPTTATLSLLALAGLAARRRRK